MHTHRSKISIYIATSIDGFIARKDGSLDWLDCVGGSEEDYGFKNFISGVDAVILGRKTYEVAVTAYGTPNWPYSGKCLIILSNTLKEVVPEARLYSGDLATLATQLQAEGIRHIWVDGGVTVSQFLRLKLVDDIILSVIPTLLGEGISLFDIQKELSCRLISAQSYSSGLVQLHYELVREGVVKREDMVFKVLTYNSEEYRQAVLLREEILRKPLGLTFSIEELAAEKDHIHIAGYLKNNLCATAVLVPEGKLIKMQRVAVKENLQSQGIGSALMAFCEEYAKKYRFEVIYCHARGTAIPFYLKHQYSVEGEPFDEDKIPHQKMRKYLHKEP